MSLEAAEEKVMTLFGPMRAIAEEANAAAQVKRDKPIMVVMGNPPYSGHSANRSWVKSNGKRLPTFIGRLLQDYYQVDGKPLGERNPKWLQDDYVKFIRWAQWRIGKTGAGVLAFITNHGYLDNPTFRGLRRALLTSFTDIYILDLHGNVKKAEVSPDGSRDENVFDIQQGVAITICVKAPTNGGSARVHHTHSWGPRPIKYELLLGTDIETTLWKRLIPQAPAYRFIEQDSNLLPEYSTGWSVVDIFRVYASTVTTARNDFAIACDAATLTSRIGEMRDRLISDEDVRNKYSLRDVSYWRLETARQQVSELTDIDGFIKPYCYRPLDFRYVFYHPAICERLRPEVMRHMHPGNVAFLTHRPQSPGEFTFAYATRMIGDQCVAANKSAGGGNSFQFPLYVYTNPWDRARLRDAGSRTLGTALGASGRVANLSPRFVANVQERLGLHFAPDGLGDLKTTFGPEDVFHYMYAVFHSPGYRSRYAEFLKVDFPRLPLTTDLALFRALAAKGAELVALHLMESPALDNRITSYPVPGSNLVDKGYPRYVAPGEAVPGTGQPTVEGRVYVNKEQYVAGVAPDVWGFHIGGYQVCDKWLKDRRGRQLSYDELTHYQKIIVALKETIRLMAEIDATIPGWPLPGSIG